MEWQLEPSIRHLNHGAFGAVPVSVSRHQAEIRAEIARNPTQFFAREIEGRLDEARGELAVFLGSDPDALAWVDNTTTGVNTVLRYVERRLGPGDEVLITDHEYNACRNAVEAMAARVGATVRQARLPFPVAEESTISEAVLSNVTSHTRLVVLDHVTSQSAMVLPIQQLVDQIESSGIPTLVDGAHAPGMLDLDLDSLGASFYVGNCHKWLCAPHGAAFLRVAAQYRDTIEPLVISHGWNDTRSERTRFRKLFDWVGTDDPSAVLSVPAAIDAVGSDAPDGWPGVMRRNHGLALEGRRIVLDRLGGDEAVPDGMIGTMATIELPPADEPSEGIVDPLTGAIRESHRIEVPVFSFPASPQRVVRLSAHLYNTVDEILTTGVLIKLESTGATMAVPWGEPVTKGGNTGRLSPGAGPADPDLVDRLKRWRLAQATAQGVPAYVIFNDATLEALAARRPSSGSALLEIPGIGPAKLEAYGDDLLDLLAD